MNKNIYVISGYIPSDEPIVYIDIWQLFKPSNNSKFVWANISQGSGIGFLTDDNGYETSEEALIGVNKFLNDITKIGKWDFEEMIKQYSIVKIELGKKLPI